MLDQVLETIKNTYDVFEKLNVSVTTLIVIALLLSLAFLFAVREAASWFLKVDDLKKDIRRMRESFSDLEAQVHSMQTLMTQAKQSGLNLVPPLEAATPPPQKSADKPSTQFPITH